MSDFWNYDLSQVPYGHSVLFVSEAGNVIQDFIYDQSHAEYFGRLKGDPLGREIVGWAHIPPVNTQQKER